MSSAANASPASQEKLSVERISEGDITCVRFRGVMEESFEGGRLGGSIKSKTVILDMGGVSKISSFGIREWSEFIGSVQRTAENIYMIECTDKVMDQINMVAGFSGKARVVSFYGPYRCDFCDIDRSVLFQVDRDSAAIRSFEPPEQLCETCARPQFFDEDPASYFSTVAQQPQFDLAAGVSEFLAAKLNYSITGGNRRLQIDKHIDDQYTYIRLRGNLDGAFPSEKVGDGLEGDVVVDVVGLGSVDQAGAAEWRNFITLARGGARRIFVVDCPPVLLERLPQTEDIGDEVVSFTMPYTCTACATTNSETIDVETHYDILKFATPPEMKCTNCKEATACAAQESLLARLRRLPKPTADAKLRAFIKTARKRKALEAQAEEAAQAPANRRLMMVVVVMMFLVVGVSGVMLYSMNENQSKLKTALEDVRQPKATDVERPPWITSNNRYSATCTQQVSEMVCVGISDYQPDRESAEAQARDIVLEGIAFNLAIQFDSELFDKDVRSRYKDHRTSQIARYETVTGDRQKAEYLAVTSVIDDARHRAAEALMAASDVIAPQHSGLHWEEYDATTGGSEFLVYVRYSVPVAAVQALMRLYTEPREFEAKGSALTAFPLLAWSHEEFTGGILVVDSEGLLQGTKRGDVVTAVGSQPVKNATEFEAARGADSEGELVKAKAIPAPEAK